MSQTRFELPESERQMAETTQETLLSFVPPQLVDWLARRDSTRDTQNAPTEVVTWFADLSDFSHMTDELTRRDKAGPEAVGDLLSRTFGAIIETVANHGGAVYDFAGDAVLATWSAHAGEGLATSLALASKCGLHVLREDLPNMRSGIPELNLRIGIGVGEARFVELGGVNGQWMFVAGGPPFNQISVASEAARPGEVLLSGEAGRAVDDRVVGHVDSDGFLRVDAVKLPELPPPASRSELSSSIVSDVRRFIPPALLNRIDAGHSEWMAEFRQVTSIFINLTSLDLQSAASRDALQDVVAETQGILMKFEGSLRQVIDDDKGVTLVASFGLPPHSHEEDPYLAVQAAEAIQGSLRQMKLEYGIGVATGRAFCGTTGSHLRRNYTTIGRDVNLAARLMKMAKFEVLCDEATATAAHRIEFHDLGQRAVKGWDRPLRVFKPLWEKRSGAIEEDLPERLVGRDSELRQLTSWLGALARARSSSVVVIEGDAGIGKSALAGKLIETARELDVRVLVGEAIPVAQAPYHAWRKLISDVLNIGDVHSQARRREIVRDRLRHRPQLLEWEALLNSVLDVDFPETATTRGMSGDNRRESTVELLVALLSDAASTSPLMIVLDDIQWFDSASWAVLIGAARKVSPLMLVVVTRPNPDQIEKLDDLASSTTSAHILLRPLEAEDALELARRAMNVDAVSPELSALINETSEGVPYFVEELAHSLRDSDALRIEGGIAHLAHPADDLAVPHSLSSVVLSRIDRLDPELQLTLKVASVVGRSFDEDELRAAHPGDPDIQELVSQLDTLERLELIVPTETGTFDFRHMLTRDTAYDLLTFDLRRRIHLGVAAYLESSGQHDREQNYALLAYHWDHGDDHRKAVEYYERSGATSLRKGANAETIFAHSRSLDIVARHREEIDEIDPIRQSQWHLEIALAYEALSSFDEAEKALYEALDLLDVKVARTPLRRTAALVWEIVRQATHIITPGLVRIPDNAEKARLAQASRVAALIGEIYYFQGNVSGFPLLNLIAINLGEKSGEPLVAGLAFSNLGYIVGTLRLRRLADRYFTRAKAAEDLETHPQLVATPYVLELQEMGPGHLIAVALAESVLSLTFGEWAEASVTITEGLERCLRLGDKYSAGIVLAVRGFVHYSSGKIEDARIDYDQLLASARQRTNREHEGWASSFSVPVLLAQGKLDEARLMTNTAVGILDEVDSLTVPIVHATRSQVLLQTGQRREALSSAQLALNRFDGSPFFIYLVGYAGMMDTFIRLAEDAATATERAEIIGEAKAGLKKLRNFARVLPFARPKYWLFKGRLQSLDGHSTRALRSLRKGLKLAEANGFTWDEGLLQLEIAKTLTPNTTERETALARATELFDLIGSVQDLDRAGELQR